MPLLMCKDNFVVEPSLLVLNRSSRLPSAASAEREERARGRIGGRRDGGGVRVWRVAKADGGGLRRHPNAASVCLPTSGR